MANPVVVTCNSTDISNSVDWKTIDATSQLTKDVGTFTFNVRQNAANLAGVTVPVVGDIINLFDSTGLIWAGTVTETEATIAGLMLTWVITCTDWGYDFNGTLVKKNYSQMDPHDIVLDIVANFAAGKGFTTNHVQYGNFLIPSVKFNYQQPSKALQSLANLIGWDWYIDPNKDIHFFLGDVDDGVGEGGTAPIFVNATGGYTGSDIEWNSLDVDLNITNMQNSVYVIGGTYPKTVTALTTPDTFLTDGTRQFFSVTYPYYSPTADSYEAVPITVTLAGTPQTVGIANQDDPADFQVMYNDQQRWIQFTAGAPSSGQTVKVYGTAKVPIIAHASDATSVATYGEYQGVITDTKILSVPEAQARATAQILQFGHPVYDVKFNTLVPGCKIGQSINFDLPAFGIAETLIIKRIEAVGYAPGANGMLEYQIECIGSDVVTFTDLMQTVLQQETNQTTVDDSTVTENLEVISEEPVVAETVTPSSTSRPYYWGSTMEIPDVSYSEANQNSSFSVYGGNNPTYVAQSFLNPNVATLAGCAFFLSATGHPTGNMTAYLYAMTGTFGSTSTPTGSPLATSDSVPASSIGSSFRLVKFSFTGANSITLAGGTHYCIVFAYTSGDSSDYVNFGFDGSGSPPGNIATSVSGTSWSHNSSDHACFYVYESIALAPQIRWGFWVWS